MPTTEIPEARRATLKRAEMSEGSTLNAEQSKRADKPPAKLKGEKLRAYILRGESTGSNSTGGRKRSAGSKLDQDAAARGTEVANSKGNAISQRITAPQQAKIRKVVEKMAGKKSIPQALGLSEQKLRQFVTGELKIARLPDEAREMVRELNRKVGDHQVWARKAAAGALGLHLTRKGGAKK